MLLNAVLSHLYYPVHLLSGYLRFLIGFLLTLPFLLIDIIRYNKLFTIDRFFAIVAKIPFGTLNQLVLLSTTHSYIIRQGLFLWYNWDICTIYCINFSFCC